MFAYLPPATRGLILVNVAVFLLQLAAGPRVLALFALWPLSTQQFEPWQLLTYAFLHGNVAHIFFNMFAVFMFGRALEEYWGSRRFVTYYFASVLAAGATQLAVQQAAGTASETIGASGGVFGLLLAFAWYFPRQRIILLFPPIPMPAWVFVTFFGVLELFLGVTGRQADVAHFAHLGGMLGGALMLLYWRASSQRF
ncbi:MAG: rhomboid family intramembrane serine protease [Gammaproteobacteria bacterium]|nr:MAG: rhomboid family intramembrane serine protease [Gammaproteobacteria bacterium]